MALKKECRYILKCKSMNLNVLSTFNCVIDYLYAAYSAYACACCHTDVCCTYANSNTDDKVTDSCPFWVVSYPSVL